MIIVLCLNASFILLDVTGVANIMGVSIGLDQTPFSAYATSAQSVETTPNNLGFSEVATIKLASILSGFWNIGFALPKVLVTIAAYVGLVNRSFEVLAVYLLLTMSSLMYLIVWAPFNALVFLSLAGSLGFGLYLLYRRLGSTTQ